MDFLIILVFFLVVLIIVYNVFLVLLDKKIKKLEIVILKTFNKRGNLIPSLYDVTKNYVSKHDEIFSEILSLRNKNLTSYDWDFLKKVNEEIYIHHEINFIFKVANKHPKIQKDSKFLLVRDLFLENSFEIWEKIKLYKIISKKFNNLLVLKNFTIIWWFLDIQKKDEI